MEKITYIKYKKKNNAYIFYCYYNFFLMRFELNTITCTKTLQIYCILEKIPF